MPDHGLKNQDFSVDIELSIDKEKMSEDELTLIEVFVPDILRLVGIEQMTEED